MFLACFSLDVWQDSFSHSPKGFRKLLRFSDGAVFKIDNESSGLRVPCQNLFPNEIGEHNLGRVIVTQYQVMLFR